MDNKTCGSCGKEISGEGEVFCPDCKGDIRRKNRKRLWYSVAAAALLFLAGSVYWYGGRNSWDFSWDAILGRPAAVINGEPVAWSEARERFKTTRVILEKQYGNDLFAGERGRAILTDMQKNVLDRILDERLVAQEARRMNIKVGDERVRQELQKIAGEIYGNWENFQASLREDGMSQEYLMNHVRNLLLGREVKKAKAPPGVDPDEYFGAWLNQARREAKVTFNKTISPLQVSSQGRGSCCSPGGGGGGCGGKQASAGSLDPELKNKASAVALTEYRKTNPVEKGVGALVTDYGCHIQVDIEKEGKIIKSYSYRDGKVFEI
ncbi:MAG: hypothetical protein A2V87_05830 [Deltaproteobacteria bacterium RBG_16_58_17]|nr:MAG: hypothetical protein A2V87_05830 [Deltaproteobacteria bacterium RBG_16_58_17]OHE16618.1 MAG: hypothetical protein A2X96_05565 [Syntrophobacterales bacterium GWC2_56_13]OHE21154.1 MAG: hypothetical protein A2X95_02595 [Syntrophobacterales bacterium GWF2_56_9]